MRSCESVLTLSLSPPFSYTSYDSKPVSVVDALSMTLKFVRESGDGVEVGGWGRERGVTLAAGESGDEDRGGNKHPRTTPHPTPR